MEKSLQKFTLLAILLFALQFTITAQPIGSKIQIGIDNHISYWDGISAWIAIAPGLPGHNLKFDAGIPVWVLNPQGITTATATSITGNSAISGGIVLSNGGANITARGVCWSTSPNPTIALTTKTNDGTGEGIYQSNITGLSALTTYFARAYATNSAGTAYGNEISFTTPLTDFDGNIYDMITIGTQVWMKQNLKTTHYNDGEAIPNVTNNNIWSTMATGAYAWYNNDKVNWGDTYGALYNWFTVGTGKLCPSGWHVPTDAEWTTLTTYLGGLSLAGGKLKEAGLVHWTTPNTGATNETGFTALPSGMRMADGTGDNSLFTHGGWWSSTENLTTNAWGRNVANTVGSVIRGNTSKKYGFSVRCLKN